MNKCPHQCWINQRQPPIRKLTEYTIINKTKKTKTQTHTLDTYIQQQSKNQKIIIFTNTGYTDLTDWNTITFYHKNLQQPNQRILRKSIMKYAESGFQITTTGNEYGKYIENTVRKITKQNNHWKRLLRKTDVEGLLDILYRGTTILTNPTEISRLKYRIESFIKRKCNLRTLPRFITITFPYDHHV